MEVSWCDFNIVGKEREYLIEAFDSGWVSGGAFVDRYEAALKALLADTGEVLSVSNGTAALQLAFLTLDVKPGDEVIVPAFCFQAAANVLIQLGVTPIYCDIDGKTLNQRIAEMKRLSSERTVGVVVVYNYGMPTPDICAISEWCRESGYWLVEDCAEAWFVEGPDRMLGRYGDIATWSTHAAKTISTGEGGVVAVNRPDLVNKAIQFRSHGLVGADRHYQHALPGNNFRMSNLHASIGLAQIEQYHEIVTDRRRVNKAYFDLLSSQPFISLQTSDFDVFKDLWAVVVNINFSALNITRDQCSDLLKAKGIATRPGFYPVSTLSYGSRCESNTPIADSVHRNLLVLPCSYRLTKGQIAYVCKTLLQIINENKKITLNFEIIESGSADYSSSAINELLPRIESGRSSFRYFDKYQPIPFENHITTVFARIDDEVFGYGHLDQNKDGVWLGVVVADSHVGMGLGREIVQKLIALAASYGVSKILLSVDKDNVSARKLYQSVGFSYHGPSQNIEAEVLSFNPEFDLKK